MRYEFKKQRQFYVLFEDGVELVRFKRSDFRKALDSLDRGSNWVGSMLTIFNKKFPLKKTYDSRVSPSDYDFPTLLTYMQDKGYRVYQPLPVSDIEIIVYLNSRGLVVEREHFSSVPISYN
jgi:hypothetical protein